MPTGRRTARTSRSSGTAKAEGGASSCPRARSLYETPNRISGASACRRTARTSPSSRSTRRDLVAPRRGPRGQGPDARRADGGPLRTLRVERRPAARSCTSVGAIGRTRAARRGPPGPRPDALPVDGIPLRPRRVPGRTCPPRARGERARSHVRSRLGADAESGPSWFDGSRIAHVAAGGNAILFNEGGEAIGGTARRLLPEDGRLARGAPRGRRRAIASRRDATRVLLRAGESSDDRARGRRDAGSDRARDRRRAWTARRSSRTESGSSSTAPRRESAALLDRGAARAPARDLARESTQGARTFVARRALGRRAGPPTRPSSPSCRSKAGRGANAPRDRARRPLGWTPDGRALYCRRDPDQGREIYTLDVKTLARKPWKELAPPDPASVTEVSGVAFAPDGSAYAYTYRRVLTSDLYVVEGLK